MWHHPQALIERAMPLTLTLLRHAKAVAGDATTSDIARELTDRGTRDVAHIGVWFAAQKRMPDLVLCSSAARTKQTLVLIRPHLGTGPATRHSKSLYLAETGHLLGTIRATAGKVQHLMLIGHNPGLGDLAAELAGEGAADLRAALATKFPTSAIAMLTFAATRWSEVAPQQGKLIALMTPKRLAARG